MKKIRFSFVKRPLRTALPVCMLILLQVFSTNVFAGNTIWNFTSLTSAATSTTNTNVPAASSTAAIGNNFGTVSTPINSSSASSTYSGATGGGNIGNAVNSGTQGNATFNSASSPYISFTLVPNTGFAITLTGIAFGARSTGTGPQAFTISTSVGGFGTSIGSGTLPNNSTWTHYTPSISSVTGTSGTTITVRVYLHGGVGTAGSGTINFRMDDINLTYNTTPSATTNSATSVTGTGAVLQGTVNDNGATTSVTFVYGTSATLASGNTTVSATPSSISAGTGSTAVSQSISSLSPGTTYYFRVSGNNTNGTSNGSILNFSTTASSPSVTVTSQTDVACNGGNTGALTVTASGGTPSYTYLWAPGGATSASISGLAAGTYTCTVTDVALGTATVSATVTQPTAVSGSTTVTNVSCDGGTNGAIDLTPSGGTAGYTYNWIGGPTTQDRTGLAAGVYTCVVTDANSCTGTVTATVTQPTAVSGSTTITDVSCDGGTNGAIDLTPGGGTAGYTYNWIGGPTTQDRTGLAAGVYTCVVTDANSCTGTVTATVTQPANISTSGDATICPGDGTGLSASGAATYTWAPATGLSATTGANVTASPTITTTYTVTGTTGGCNNSLSLTVTVLPTYIITATTGSNGTISPLGTVSVCHGADQVYTISPNVGFAVADVTVDGSSVGAVTSYTMTAIAATHTIHATFAAGCAPPGITGTLVICNGSTTGLSNTVTGGTWTSSNAAVASVNTSTGVVTGNSAGVATITYIVGSDISCFVTAQVTINAVPAPIYLMGPSSVCQGFTVGLTNAMGSGTWASANTAVATIGMTSGILTGIAPGTAIITYTQYTGCYTTRIQTVNEVPATITGTDMFCTGATSAFSTGATGGVWRSIHTAVASIDSVTGVATGVHGGLATIRYEMPTGCFSAISTTVNHLPTAISGTLSMCEGGTTNLSSPTSGGTWSSVTPATATIGASTGVVTGVATGMATISYTNSNGCARTAEVTVNTAPPAIAGSASMCVGATSALSNVVTGGTWTSSNTARATVGVTSGIVNGLTAGTATITYHVPGAGCFTSLEVTVNATPAAITGTTTVCVGSSTTLSHPVSGGTWASSNPARATVDASTGEYTGISVGSAFITYTTSPGCFKTIVVNVQAPPTLTTTGIVCEGATTAIGYYPTGGTWASSSTDNATVNTIGIVTGVIAGTTLISYTKSPGCMSTVEVTVNPMPTTITGNAAVCVGSTETLSSTPGGGTWASSSVAKATVGSSSGDVTGVAAGNATITYTAGGCRRIIVVTVGTMPGAITGTMHVCAGSTTTLASSPTGGTWNSSNTAAATIPMTGAGIVTGVDAGMTTISYTRGGCVRTATVTVNAALTTITGDLLVCAGNTSALGNATTGGTWTSSTTSKAYVNMTSGVMTGVSAGSTTITYRIGTTCFTTAQATVNTGVAAITGTTNLCIGATTTLSTAETGGSWASSNTERATVDASTGEVTGVSTGTAIISYIQSTGCYKTITVVVNALPAAITGTASVCQGSATALSTTTGGGTWSSSSTSTATVTTGGSVTGVSAGNATITYRLSTTGCMATREVTVNPLPSEISGPAPICAGTTNTFTATPGGGLWNSSTATVASVGSSSGEVTGLISGSTTLSYTLPTGCRRTLAIGVNPMPNSITGTASMFVGESTTLSSSTAGGTWGSSDGAIATVASGVVTGMDAGTATITYQLTSTGCYRTREVTVNFLSSSKPAISVDAAADMFNVFPNPSTGTLKITASIKGMFTVYTVDGKLIEQYTVSSTAVTLSLPYNLAAGIYMCRFNGEDGSVKMVRLVYQP